MKSKNIEKDSYYDRLAAAYVALENDLKAVKEGITLIEFEYKYTVKFRISGLAVQKRLELLQKLGKVEYDSAEGVYKWMFSDQTK